MMMGRPHGETLQARTVGIEGGGAYFGGDEGGGEKTVGVVVGGDGGGVTSEMGVRPAAVAASVSPDTTDTEVDVTVVPSADEAILVSWITAYKFFTIDSAESPPARTTKKERIAEPEVTLIARSASPTPAAPAKPLSAFEYADESVE